MFSFNSLKAILYVVYNLGANSQKHLSYHKSDHLLIIYRHHSNVPHLL
nr:MAG TPA: hypothetical protein [Caudoviricetes sp.]